MMKTVRSSSHSHWISTFSLTAVNATSFSSLAHLLYREPLTPLSHTLFPHTCLLISCPNLTLHYVLPDSILPLTLTATQPPISVNLINALYHSFTHPPFLGVISSSLYLSTTPSHHLHFLYVYRGASVCQISASSRRALFLFRSLHIQYASCLFSLTLFVHLFSVKPVLILSTK